MNSILKKLRELVDAVWQTADVYGTDTAVNFLNNALATYEFHGNQTNANHHDSECIFVNLFDQVVRAPYYDDASYFVVGDGQGYYALAHFAGTGKPVLIAVTEFVFNTIDEAQREIERRQNAPLDSEV